MKTNLTCKDLLCVTHFNKQTLQQMKKKCKLNRPKTVPDDQSHPSLTISPLKNYTPDI